MHALVYDDVLTNLQRKAFPFFERFEDTNELLRTLQEDEDAMGQLEGVWEFGRPGSIARLLNTGFAAIELKNWTLAARCLAECRSKVEATADILKKQIASTYLPIIEQGLEAAAAKHSWRPPS
jgi:hypothetical protein